MLNPRMAARPITEVDPKPRETDLALADLAAYRRFIELPVREAVMALNQHGITTISSSANHLDIGRTGHISISFDDLSPGNRCVALELVNEGAAIVSRRFDRTVLIIEFPVLPDDTVGDIAARVARLCERFGPNEAA